MSTLDDVTVQKVEQAGPASNSEFVYVDIGSVDNRTKRIVEPKRMPADEAPSRARQCLRAGDVLVSMTRPNLNAVALVPPELDGSIGSTGFHVLRAKDGVDPRWIFNAVQSRDFIETMEGFVQGALYPAVRPKDIRGYQLHVPPMEEQKRVLAELKKQFSRLDEAVANLQRVKANLKRYKASVLKDAVEGRLVPTEAELARREGRSFETGEQLLEKVSERRRAAARGKRRELLEPEFGALIDAPEGWVWTTCDAAIDAIDAGASFKCVEQPPRDGEVGVLKVSAVSWGIYNEDESKTCIDVNRIEKSYLVNPGDFLFSRANTIELVGACVIVGTVRKQLMLSDKTLRFKISDSVIPNWLLVCLRTRFGRREIERLATGNQESMRNIGQGRIRQIRMPLPPLSEQERIVGEVDRRLSLVRGVEAEVDSNIKRAQALRQSVLSKSFSE